VAVFWDDRSIRTAFGEGAGMSQESEWVELRTLPLGTLFADVNGRHWLSTNGRRNDPLEVRCQVVGAGSGWDWFFPVASVRPLTPVPVSPALHADLRGLLLHALATGDTAALTAGLLEANSDRDAADAIRENVRRDAGSKCPTCGSACLGCSMAVAGRTMNEIASANYASIRAALEHHQRLTDPPR
jgi:hypothetical protein